MFSFFRKTPGFWPKLAVIDWAVLFAGIIAFLGLTASTVTKFSIWFDEAFGSYLVRFDFYELTRYTAFDVHPPFYYWLLKIWTMMFGNTELGIRSMSIFFGIVTVVLAFTLALRLFGRRTAYFTLIFLVLSPLFLRYSQEARMYTVLTSIVLLATHVLLYAEEQGKKRWPWVLYGVLLAIGMLTQYFAALAWLAHWVWRYLKVRAPKDTWKQTKKKFFTKEWVLAHLVGIGLFLPWLPFMAWQFAVVQGFGFWIPPVTSITLNDFLTNILLFSDYRSVQSWLALGVYVLFGVMIYLAVQLYKRLDDAHKTSYTLAMVMIGAPVVLLLLMSMPPLRPAFMDRYLMVSVVFLPLFIGATLALGTKILSVHKRMVVGTILVAMMIIGISNQMAIGNYNKSTVQSNNVRQLLEAVRFINPDAQIVSNTPWVFYEAVIYEQPQSPIYFVNETTTYEYGSLRMLQENDALKIKDLDGYAKQKKDFWLIGNLRSGEVKSLRPSWHERESVVINDDISGQPLFKAIRFSAE